MLVEIVVVVVQRLVAIDVVASREPDSLQFVAVEMVDYS
jgi:hypothetical protein